MLKHVELDPTFRLDRGSGDSSNKTTILINVFDVDPADHEFFKRAWLTDAKFFAAQPGYISAQLHQGILGSRMFLNYAVFENTAAFAATNDQPEFGPLRAVYPDSATAHPHLFRRLAVPGICVGESDASSDVQATKQGHGLQQVELDPSFSLEQQFAHPTTQTTIVVNLFDVDHEDQKHFKAAWCKTAHFFRSQPGCISVQLHQGLEGSRLFLDYAIFENTAVFAATNDQPEFDNLRTVYPDSATAQTHLFRRLSIPGVCVGEGNRNTA